MTTKKQERKCMDCSFPREDKACPHFDPQHWVDLGYERNWGDAAVMLDDFEVLKKTNADGKSASFIILAPELRCPLHLYAFIDGKKITSHGAY